MGRFRFRLQNILNVKKQMENQEKIAFSTASLLLSEAEEKLQEMRHRKETYEAESRLLVQGKIDFRKIQQCRNAIYVVEEQIKEQIVEVRTAQMNVEAARRRLNEVMIERKTYEKLRERALEKFRRQEVYEENKVIDELVSYMHGEDVE